MKQTINSSSWRSSILFLRTWSTGQALLFFTLASSLMLYPIWLHLFDRLAVGGDAYEYIWKLWWFKHSLLSGQSPWLAPQIYYPHGYLLAYGELTPVNTILALPLTLLLGEIPTYNLLVLFSTILSGFTMFLLAREVTGSFWAGLLAGTIFAFAPFRRLQVLHLNVLATQWLPLLFYFLERLARTRKPAYGLAAGVAFGLNALASWYYAVAGALFMLVWGLFRFRPLAASLRSRRLWLAAGLFTIAAGLLVLPFAWPYQAVLGNPDTAIPMDNSNFYSASPVEYVLPSPFQFLWGRWVFQHLYNRPEPGEFIIGWGFVAWLFALYGLGLAPRREVRPWLAVVLVAFILSLGLTLHLAGRQVVIPAPQPVVEQFNEWLNTISLDYARDPEAFIIGREDGLVVPMPALLLRWFVPVLGKMRTWTRFGFIALFGIAVLAALGAAAWQRRELKPKNSQLIERGAWLVVIGLTFFELWWAPLPMITPVLERPVDGWLRSQPGQEAIIEYPLNSSFNGQQLVYTLTHQRPIVHGYGLFLGFMMGRRHPELLAFPERPALQQLADWDVGYVLIETAPPYTAEAQALLARISQESCLQPQGIFDTVYVFQLVGCER